MDEWVKMMKTKKSQLVLILLMFFAFHGWAYSIEFTLNDPLTPFYLMKIPFENLPENVHFIEAKITVSNGTSQLIHQSYYPILSDLTGVPFSLIHFIWTIGLNQEPSMDSHTHILVSYDFESPFHPYSMLLQVDYEPITRSRHVLKSFNTNQKGIDEQSLTATHSKAVIFIHGIQGGRYQNILETFSNPSSNDWKNEDLRQYWINHYQYDDVDYFEFQYDSLFESAQYYGETLGQILEQSGILETYQQVYFVAYSMGTIVARYALNTPTEQLGGFLGDYISKTFLIGGVLEGTFFTNLVDYCITQIPVEKNPQLIKTDHSAIEMMDLTGMLNILFHFEQYAYDPNIMMTFLERFVFLYQTNPLLANVMFISGEDIPFIGGQIIPFKGMSSMRYTSEEFLQQLENRLTFPIGTYILNHPLLELNEIDRFYSKQILFTSFILEPQETLDKMIALSSRLNLQGLFQGTQQEKTQILSIPYVRFIGQRALSLIMERLANHADNPLHAMNDGFVTLWSERLTAHQSEIDSKNIFLFENLDHAQIKDHPQVLQTLKKLILQD